MTMLGWVTALKRLNHTDKPGHILSGLLNSSQPLFTKQYYCTLYACYSSLLFGTRNPWPAC